MSGSCQPDRDARAPRERLRRGRFRDTPGADGDLAGGVRLRFVSFVIAPAQAAPVRAPSGACKRVALILTWIAAALLASFATTGVAVAQSAPAVTSSSANQGPAAGGHVTDIGSAIKADATPDLIPGVKSISPTSGPATGGTLVTITGTLLGTTKSVTFGGVSANFTIVSSTVVTATSPPGGGTVDVQVTNQSGMSPTGAADQFTYTGSTGTPPTVTAISPTSGLVGGGTSVTITGTNFVGVSSVSFGGVLGNFTVVSPTQITATTPAFSTPGIVAVSVTAEGMTSAFNPAAEFTDISGSAPTVTGVNPNSGSSAGGLLVTVTGSGFVGATSVKFGTTAATSFTVNSDTQLTVLTPANVPGTVDVTVASSLGTSTTGTSDHFTFVGGAPVVSAVNPTSGSTAGGTSVTISGSGFTGATSVKFGATSATFTVNSDASITATSPAGSTGAVDVTITTPVGPSATSASDVFTYTSPPPAPTVTSISPTSGAIAGGTTVTVTGTNFTGATAVKFGTVSATFTVNSATSITATSPAGSAGAVDVTVTTSAGASATSTADQFTYTSSPAAPTVTAISPTSGTTAGGTSVTVTGANFTGATAVRFGTASATFTVNSTTSITATSPASSTGAVDVTVTTPGGTSATGAEDQFTYQSSAGTPQITAINPTGGPTTGGTSVIITGSGFTGATAAKFGTKAASSFTVNSDTQVTAVSPSGTGTVDVTITTANGASATVAADRFTYGAVPAVSRINPTSGPSSGGTTVTVTGSAFTGATAVTFGGVAAQSFSVTNATTISAVSPPGSGTVDVLITTPVGTSVAGTVDPFAYRGGASPPTVTAVSPTGGPTTGGASVTVTGTNFTGATAVKFGTTSASFTVNSATSITATSPAGSAGAVDVTVTTSAGTSTTSSADQFTYTSSPPPAPTVTSVSPTSGPTAGGTSVTITGANFSGATAVKFGTASATFTVNSATSITATSPAGTAGAVDITVTTSGGTNATSSPDQFVYQATASPPTVSSLSPASGSIAGGTGVTITGTNFTGATVVKFGTASAAFTVNNATSITATAPAGSAGAVDVTVTTSAGTSATGASDQFTYQASLAPAVTAISPNEGPGAGGTTVTITGQNLSTTNPPTVKFGATASASVSVISSTSLTATAPASLLGPTDVTVTTEYGQSTLSPADVFTYTNSGTAPVVNSVTPAQGPIAGGGTVTIAGVNFAGATAVKFGSVAATFTVTSLTTISATPPAQAAGSVDVIVTTNAGTSAAGSSDKYDYVDGTPSPTIDLVSPSSGPTQGGTTVTITGTNLSGASAVKFGASATASFTVNSSTQITAVTPAGSAGTVFVSVTTATGTASGGNNEAFTYVAPPIPTIQTVTPNAGPTAGGTAITISGANFTGATAVSVGGIAVPRFTVTNDNTINTVTGASSAAGVAAVSVTTPAGTGTGGQFTYSTGPVPTVTAISPGSGPSIGFTDVTVTGTNFVAGQTTVFFGAVASNSVIVNSSTSLSVVSPAGAVGTVDITVANADGTSTPSAADKFAYTATPVPVVTGVTPTGEPANLLNAVTISGSGFTTFVSGVKFGGVSSTNFTVQDDNTIMAVPPAGTVNTTVDVVVTSLSGTSAVSGSDKFSYLANSSLPTVTAVSPSSGPTTGGVPVTLTGTFFTGATAVKFGGTAATAFTVNSDTSITVMPPAGTAGAVDVTVTNTSGASGATAADKYTYVSLPPVAAISSISPTGGPSGGLTTVTITGTNFTSASAVTFGGTPATFFSVNSDTQITTASPGSSVSGAVDIVITTPSGVSAKVAADKFTYTLSPPPTVTGVNPLHGTSSGGNQVTISGTNLTGPTAVMFGNTPALQISTISDTAAFAIAPPGVGTVDVVVTTPTGASPVNAADKYSYDIGAPTISATFPTSVSAAGGTSVTLTGQNFEGVTAVSITGGVVAPATSFTVVGPTSMTVIMPPDLPGPASITVKNSVGSASIAIAYTSPAPEVTAVSPSNGSTVGGTTVNITGIQFTGATGVSFGETRAIGFAVNSDTSITAVAPPGAVGPVDVTVSNASGVSLRNDNDEFIYQSAPVPQVGAVSPSSGQPGTNVFVTGSGFTGATAVRFGSTLATTFTIDNDEKIEANVPAGAGSGTVDITVVTPGGSSAPGANDKFTLIAASSAPTIAAITPSHGPLNGGASVTITGTGFTSDTTVKFGANGPLGWQIISPTEINAVSPAGSAGTVDITVTNLQGTSATSIADQFTYSNAAPQPVVLSLTPNSGLTGGGTSVSISGRSFTGATAVKFGTASAQSFTINNDNSITATSPAGSGVEDVTVTSAGGVSGVVPEDRFTYLASNTPVITAITPTDGGAGGGGTIQISGFNFTGATAVKFGSASASQFSVNSAGQIVTQSPAGTGVVDISVTTPSGTSASTAADKFTYVPDNTVAPVITSVNPATGLTSGGTSVVITGSGFTGTTGVKFGANAAASFAVNSDQQITVIAPAGGAGAVDISVTSVNGTSTTGSSDRFTYVASGVAPSVSGLSPSSGPTSGATNVVVTGSGFTGAIAVKFGSEEAAGFTINSDSQITATSPVGAAGVVDLIVSNPTATSASVAADHFTYTSAGAAPAITAVSPSAGPTSGGTSVTVTGSGFTGATTVKFGATAATSFTVNSDSQITAVSPSGAAGVVDVAVTTPSGTSASVAGDHFTYTAGPNVTGLSPTGGPTAGGTSVKLTGSGFTGATAVKFGPTAATTFTVSSDTQITVTSPAATAGTVDVTVTSGSGTSATSAADHFTYAATPTVTAIAPTSGTTAGATSVIVTGSGFTGATAVKFGATAATTFTVNSDTQITATSPAASAGAVDVTVTTSVGTSATSAADQFTYAASTLPIVASISPTGGVTTGGTSVTITGSGFTGATAVKFGTKAATTFSVVNDTQVTATSPSGSGTVDITVTTPNGTSATSAADKFTYGAVPAVTRIAPTSGASTGGTTVTITGSAFTGATAVTFGGVAAQSFSVTNATTITAVSPPGSGTVDVLVTTPVGTSVARTLDHFTYTGAAPAPTVTAVSPTSGSTAGGTSVTITGTNFTGATAVKFGAASASFTVTSATSITATSPAGSAGAVDVTVTTSAGTSATGAADQFTYTASASPPTVTSVSPNSGVTTANQNVTIAGTNFTGATAVMFGTQLTLFTVNSATSITASAPSGSVGTVDITVTTPAGVSATSSADRYTFTAPPPTVTNVSPGSGPTAGGTSVTITGTSFTGATAIKFGTTAATTFTVNNDSQITVISPAGSAGGVNITVTTPGGTSTTNGGDLFSYLTAPPAVTSVSPNFGPTTGSTSVTITGTNFTGATAIKFGTANAVEASVTSPTTIIGFSPPGVAGTVDVTVTTTLGTSATSAADQFTYSVPPTVTGISTTSGPTSGGTSVTITGTNFTNVQVVQFGGLPAASITVNSPTSITVTSPAESAGVVDITVRTNAGVSATSAADQFTYQAQASPPTVTGASPNSGPTSGGTSVTLSGTNFTGATSVRFGVASATFTVNSATSITATSPAGSAGAVDVTVTTSAGTSAASPADQFTYTSAAGAPMVTAISPAGGAPAGGTSVTITGSGFTGATAVKFGTKATTAFTINSDTQVTATSPSGTGTVDITLTTANGTSATSAVDQFVYQAAPVVSGINPVTGPAAGGTTVTVNGTGFTGATQVMFGTVQATSFTVVSASKITAVSPAGTGTVDVLVTTASGTSVARAIDHFVYKASGAIKGVATLRVRVGSDATAQIDLTRGTQASGGKVMMMTPSSAGTAKIVAGAAPGSVSLAFTPSPGFSGQATVSYALDAASPDVASATGDVEITVDARPDPSADGGVKGVIQAETDASLRFADAQISNFDQHLESLHGDGHGKGGNGVNFNFGFGQDQPNLFAQRNVDSSRIVGDAAWPTPALGPDPQAKQPAPSKYPARAAAGPGLGNGSGDSPLTVWTGGAITFGQTDATTLRPGFRFTSDGLSAGVDARVSGQLTLGAGAGVGQSYAQVDGGSRVDGHDFVGVLYGDYRPVKSAFLDVIAGWGRLDFTSHRIVSPGATALGDRSGDDPFLSVTAGWIIARDGGFKLTPYGRLDEISGRLDAFTEHGAGTSDLRYDEQSFNSLQGTLGLKGEWRIPTGYGDWTPRFRFEAHHEFDGTGLAGVNYADDLAGPPFTTQADPMRTDSLSAGIGADLHWQNKTFNLDYTATSDLVRQTVHELRAKLEFKFW